MKGEGHLSIGGAPTDLSTKGAKILNKKKKKKKSHNTTHDLVNKSKLNDLAKDLAKSI